MGTGAFSRVILATSNEGTKVAVKCISKNGELKQVSEDRLLRGEGIPLSESQMRSYFRQLVHALNYLHHHGVIHRDIKPANLVVDKDTGVLKVADFGIAILSERNSIPKKAGKLLGGDDTVFCGYNACTGTPAFLPPEYYAVQHEDLALHLDEASRLNEFRLLKKKMMNNHV